MAIMSFILYEVLLKIIRNMSQFFYCEKNPQIDLLDES